MIARYGTNWPDGSDTLQIERECVRFGGEWISKSGRKCGDGLFAHYRNIQSLLWPEDDHHRWSDQILHVLLDNRISVLAGSRDSGKTRCCSKFALVDYWCFPDETLILMSSTTITGLELRVWGDIKSLIKRAKERYPWLEGNVVDAKKGFFTDNISERSEYRDMRRGIIGIPTLSQQNEFQGDMLRNFAGIKQKRRRLIGDELQFIPVSYLDILANLDEGDFKASFVGNPIGGNGKALDKVMEPEGGWGAEGKVTKTVTWKNKFGGVTLNLIGTDSPNFDEATKDKFSYLVSSKSVERVKKQFGEKSLQFHSQILGVRVTGAESNRVMTSQEIELWGGYKPCVWSQSPDLNIYAVDAGYGGDLCVGIQVECGNDVDGQRVMKFGLMEVIPVMVGIEQSPETQIVRYVKSKCASKGVPDEKVFVEAGMRATLATEFGRVMSPAVNMINFGGQATDRPVSNDLYVVEKDGTKRLKKCSEHYDKFVTELAFSVRELVRSSQAREFPKEAASEFERRKWEFVYGDRYRLETKDDYKKRNGGVSPNYMDSCFPAGTMVATPSGEVAIEKLCTGQLVLTPFGPTQIMSWYKVQATELVCAELINGRKLTSTPDHKIFTFDKGWQRMDAITIDNELESVDNLPVWNILNQWFTKDTRTGFSTLVDIISTETTEGLGRRDFYTGLSGLNIMGLFQRGWQFITGMVTGQITKSKIWSVLSEESISATTWFSGWLIRFRKLCYCETLTRQCSPLRGGIAPRLDVNGIESTVLNVGKTESRSSASAKDAVNYLSRFTQKSQGGVRCGVETSSLCRKIKLTIASAVCVVRNLLRTNTVRRGLVLRDVVHWKLQKPVSVYNLTLFEHNAYYANGVLVKNCMIAVEGARRLGFVIERMKEVTAMVEDDWLGDEIREQEQLDRSRELTYE